jgi:1-acyl-sn-glycerol-3-phosphate acyltransferase
MLARRTGAQVVPVGVVGTHKVLPKGQSKPKRGKVLVAYGEPFTYADVEAKHGKAAKDMFARELSDRILELCNLNGLTLKSAPTSQAIPASDSVGTQP